MGLVLDKNSFLSVSWNRLDFIIVIASFQEYVFKLILNDQNNVSDNLEILKILRMLRILRPLRFISHNKNLRIIVNSLLGSFNGIFNVTIVILLIFIMFSILGVFLFSNRMNYCERTDTPDFDSFEISKKMCAEFYDGV